MPRWQLAFVALLAALSGGPRDALAASGQGGSGRGAHRGPAIAGRYDSPLGRLELAVQGAAVTGKLLAPARSCPFAAGDEVLRGTVLDDSVAGQLRIWLRGDGCKAGQAWGNAVLLVGKAGLSGAVHVEDANCTTPLGPRGGLTLVRVDAGGRAGAPGSSAESPRARRERARTVMRDGAAWLGEGSFEAARKRFLEALEIDPRVPEALNGVGVTYRMRNDLAAALEWYKKALAVDPDFGDAYYNMACVYALQGQKDLALRYLQIAALNGYASAEGIDADPDLSTLHDEPGYRALLKARL
jgi:Flp pilus assembly protein TadD